MIREATRDDVGDIVTMMVKNIRERKWLEDSGTELDTYTLRTICNYHIRDTNGCLFVHVTDGVIDGAILGGMMPWLLDIRHMAAHEKMTMGEGITELWLAFLNWAKGKNAITCVRGCYDAFDGSRFRRVV